MVGWNMSKFFHENLQAVLRCWKMLEVFFSFGSQVIAGGCEKCGRKLERQLEEVASPNLVFAMVFDGPSVDKLQPSRMVIVIFVFVF